MSTPVGHNNKLPNDLAQLQNLIKKDPESYIDEFERQYEMFQATKLLFEHDPMSFNEDLHGLISFMAQVSHCYTEKLKSFPTDLMQMLNHHATINPEIRLAIVKSLILLKNKNLLDQLSLIKVFFDLLHTQDKVLRTFIKENIVNDLANIHKKKKDERVKKEMQNFMANMMKNGHAVAEKTALDIMIEMHNKNLWTDARSVNIIAESCFSKIVKVNVAAMKFFIMKDDDEKEDSDSEEEPDYKSISKAKHTLRINKTKKGNRKLLEKAKQVKKKKKVENKSLSPIYLVHDPQSIADKVYKKLQKMNERFEVKLLLMQFLSQLIGIHELYVPNFYSFIKRYLFVQQREVTKIMTCLAQSVHSQVPPDDIEPLVRTLADNFVTDRYRGEVMAMGLNAIRALCERNSFAITEDLLGDLIQFRTHKDKSVAKAASELNFFFQEANPSLLPRKFRSAKTELQAENDVREYGKLDAKSYIPGAEILAFIDENPINNESNDSDYTDMSDDEESDTENKEKPKNKKSSISKAEEEALKLTPEERAAHSIEIISNRFLTDDDFKKIARIQNTKKIERYSKSRKTSNKKRPLEEEEEEEDTGTGDIVNLSSIEMVHKRRKHDKESRMETVLEGRQNREKYGSKKGQRLNPFASKTNREFIKSKNYTMVKHKIAGNKRMKTFRERQLNLKKKLLSNYK